MSVRYASDIVLVLRLESLLAIMLWNVAIYLLWMCPYTFHLSCCFPLTLSPSDRFLSCFHIVFFRIYLVAWV